MDQPDRLFLAACKTNRPLNTEFSIWRVDKATSLICCPDTRNGAPNCTVDRTCKHANKLQEGVLAAIRAAASQCIPRFGQAGCLADIVFRTAEEDYDSKYETYASAIASMPILQDGSPPSMLVLRHPEIYTREHFGEIGRCREELRVSRELVAERVCRSRNCAHNGTDASIRFAPTPNPPTVDVILFSRQLMRNCRVVSQMCLCGYISHPNIRSSLWLVPFDEKTLFSIELAADIVHSVLNSTSIGHITRDLNNCLSSNFDMTQTALLDEHKMSFFINYVIENSMEMADLKENGELFSGTDDGVRITDVVNVGPHVRVVKGKKNLPKATENVRNRTPLGSVITLSNGKNM